MKGEKIILPEISWSKAVEKSHQGGHPGIVSLKKRLQCHFWFPMLNKMAEEKVKSCPSCQLFTGKGLKEPIRPQRVTEQPWELVNIDLFGPTPYINHILVVQDSHSRFPCATPVASTAAVPVLRALDNIYTNYGYPDMNITVTMDLRSIRKLLKGTTPRME